MRVHLASDLPTTKSPKWFRSHMLGWDIESFEPRATRRDVHLGASESALQVPLWQFPVRGPARSPGRGAEDWSALAGAGRRDLLADGCYILAGCLCVRQQGGQL